MKYASSTHPPLYKIFGSVATIAALIVVLSHLATAPVQAQAAPKPLPPPDQKADPQMKAVIEELAKMNPVPLYNALQRSTN